MFDVLRDDRGSTTKVMQEMNRRKKRFAKQGRDRPAGLPLPARTAAAVREALGFLIGEAPP